MFRGGVYDDTLPSEAMVTWENTAGHGGSFQWLGYRSTEYINAKILITFMVKFVQKKPDLNKVALKVYGQMHKSWVANCHPDKWCEESLEFQNLEYGDNGVIILIFDDVNDFQTIRIGYFDIKIL